MVSPIKNWTITQHFFIPLRFATGIAPNPDMSGLDNSSNVSNFTPFVFNETHYNLQILLHFVCNI